MSTQSERHPKYYEQLKTALNKAGYAKITKIAESLQGGIYKALHTPYNIPVAIKITNKQLHQQKTALSEGRQYYNIQENILLEASILKHLTNQKNCPETIVKYCQFLSCNTNYYLVQTNGGGNLFDFVKQAHNLVSLGHISESEWHKVSKVIFRQMIDTIEYIHSKRVVHHDVSLENFLINDIQIMYNRTANAKGDSAITFNGSDIQIKLIDFGLAAYFEPKQRLKSNKYVGKPGYKCPEIVSKKKSFDPIKADIWSLGVVLFMMVFGCKPFLTANKSDHIFSMVMKGEIMEVLHAWNIFEVSPDLIDLFRCFFRYEKKRCSLKQIKKHKWLN